MTDSPAGQLQQLEREALTSGLAADPYPLYADMREIHPVIRVTRPNGLEEFLVYRYEDAKAALADLRLSKDQRHAEDSLSAARVPRLGPQMLNSDPPEHTRLRKAVSEFFGTGRVERLRPSVAAASDRLIDGFRGVGRADLMADFAFKLPMAVIGDILGVPPSDRDALRTWTQLAMLPHFDPRRATGYELLTGYLCELIDAKAAAPENDLLSELVSGRKSAELSKAEVVGTARLLVVAGHDTSVNLIGNGMLAVLTRPALLARLRADPLLIPGAVEEFLRYDGPVEFATMRFAVEDLEIAGVPIPRGSIVSIVIASANRDHSAFAEADEIDLDRRTRHRHLAFGHGIHFCLGAPLARMEGQVAIHALIQRLDDLALAEPVESLTWRESLVMRGLDRLPVTFTAPPAADPEAAHDQGT